MYPEESIRLSSVKRARYRRSWGTHPAVFLGDLPVEAGRSCLPGQAARSVTGTIACGDKAAPASTSRSLGRPMICPS